MTTRDAFEAFRSALERGDVDAVIDLYDEDEPSSAQPAGKAAIGERLTTASMRQAARFSIASSSVPGTNPA